MNQQNFSVLQKMLSILSDYVKKSKSPFVGLSKQAEKIAKGPISLRINKKSGFRPVEWSDELKFFEQDYTVVGKKNGKNLYENFSFKDGNRTNRARIYWGPHEGKFAWIAQGRVRKSEIIV